MQALYKNDPGPILRQCFEDPRFPRLLTCEDMQALYKNDPGPILRQCLKDPRLPRLLTW